jgi:hypothetical protein
LAGRGLLQGTHLASESALQALRYCPAAQADVPQDAQTAPLL